ncbi:MAG: hypothetical protein J6Y91_06215 [Alphaproteobacteria bacterium]|nr:hypothetical protein [Alphaproteobacteria bacterium]
MIRGIARQFEIFKEITTKQKALLLFAFALAFIAMLLIIQESPQQPTAQIIIIMITAILVLDYVVFSICKNIFCKHLPYSYPEKRSLFGEPQQTLKSVSSYIGQLLFKNISTKIEIYRDKIVISAFRRCLLITSAEQIKITPGIWYCTVECRVDKSVVRCYIRLNRVAPLMDWVESKRTQTGKNDADKK